MKSTIEHLNPTRVKISVEVPFDELKPHFDKAYGTLAGQVRIPGFRPGKVPARILDARLGRGAILSEVVNDAVPAKYGEAVSEANLVVMGQPDIEVTRIDDGEILEFTAEVDVRPEIVVPPLDGVSVQVDDVQVSDADIDEQIEALRERFGTVAPVDRPAQAGDLVVLDLSAEVDGEPVDEAASTGLSYTVGRGDLVEGLDDAITGSSAGDTATFGTALVAGEHAGRDAEVTVTLTSVSHRELPEVDDDFAGLASEFDTVAEMRADLAERVARVKRLQQGGEARDAVLNALLEQTEVPAPEAVVVAEFQARQHDAVHSFDHDEDALNAYLLTQGQTREEFDAETREAAEQAVRAQLLLDTLADAQQVTVDQEEFTERIIYSAQRAGVAPDEYFQRLQENNQIGAIISDVRRGKALAFAVQQATVTDASGQVLDVAALFGLETVPDDDLVDAEADLDDDEAIDMEHDEDDDRVIEADTDVAGVDHLEKS
ncbi:MAG: trigger factor [Actinomycetota bacterium]|nr:trigger factor [Actinomycetota bacterium]